MSRIRLSISFAPRLHKFYASHIISSTCTHEAQFFCLLFAVHQAQRIPWLPNAEFLVISGKPVAAKKLLKNSKSRALDSQEILPAEATVKSICRKMKFFLAAAVISPTGAFPPKQSFRATDVRRTPTINNRQRDTLIVFRSLELRIRFCPHLAGRILPAVHISSIGVLQC